MTHQVYAIKRRGGGWSFAHAWQGDVALCGYTGGDSDQRKGTSSPLRACGVCSSKAGEPIVPEVVIKFSPFGKR